MTNFTICFWDNSFSSIAVAHATHFADAVSIAESLPHCDIMDSHTGEVLRSYRKGKIVYMV